MARSNRSVACPARSSSLDNNPRRQFLLSSTALLTLGQCKIALADGEGENVPYYARFSGKATPPSSYGGYGGAESLQVEKYTFEYPSAWKEAAPTKVEKGSLGIDGKVVNPKVKGQRAIVITFGRDGEDNAQYRPGDLDRTLRGFAGTDSELMEAYESADEVSSDKVNRFGGIYYTYFINAPDVKYRASVTVNNGKMFALFVRTPVKAWDSGRKDVEHLLETFNVNDERSY